MELILHEASGNIELQYGQIQFEDVDNKVVGIENASGTDGIEILFMLSSAPFPNGHIVYQNQGFLISRIPEPSTGALAGVCLIALACRYRRRKADDVSANQCQFDAYRPPRHADLDDL
jgi:hypothetical protein